MQADRERENMLLMVVALGSVYVWITKSESRLLTAVDV